MTEKTRLECIDILRKHIDALQNDLNKLVEEQAQHEYDIHKMMLNDVRNSPVRSFKGMDWDDQHDYIRLISEAYGVKNAIYSAGYDLDEVAIQGEATVKGYGWDDEVFTEKVNSPTWLDLLIVADKMIDVVDDHHHVFLEGIYRDGDDPLGNTYIFSMGS